MIPITKITGRLGNQMFEFAALYSFAKDLNLDYYFQDEKFFKKYEKDIRQLFSTGIGHDDRVSIHVRRTDYVNNPFYVDLISSGYYTEAMKLFPKEGFLIFSDDIEFCKKYFIGSQFDFATGNDEVTDLNLMASCKSNIIANSSFSWWAAYLNSNPTKKVIYPKKWYSDGKVRTVCPSDWISL